MRPIFLIFKKRQGILGPIFLKFKKLKGRQVPWPIFLFADSPCTPQGGCLSVQTECAVYSNQLRHLPPFFPPLPKIKSCSPRVLPRKSLGGRHSRRSKGRYCAVDPGLLIRAGAHDPCLQLPPKNWGVICELWRPVSQQRVQ